MNNPEYIADTRSTGWVPVKTIDHALSIALAITQFSTYKAIISVTDPVIDGDPYFDRVYFSSRDRINYTAALDGKEININNIKKDGYNDPINYHQITVIIYKP